MNSQRLMDTAKALVADDKGLLAMDESNPTCNKRFARLGIPETVEARRAYRELIVTTPGLSESISGAILYDETIRQQKKDGTLFIKVLADAGIIPGIKVDTGAKDMAAHFGEKVTEGLDGLRDRLAEYSQMGARFAKWRAVIAVGDGIPSRGCIEANAHALARYAALCQEAGLVPVVEAEVLMGGKHTMERCRELTEEVLRSVFSHESGVIRLWHRYLDLIYFLFCDAFGDCRQSRGPSQKELAFRFGNCSLRATIFPFLAALSAGACGDRNFRYPGDLDSCLGRSRNAFSSWGAWSSRLWLCSCINFRGNVQRRYRHPSF